MSVPNGKFRWGAASSAVQIEGAWDVDGRGESNWDRWSHTPGKIKDGSTTDVTIDRFHRWPEDLELLAQMNLNAYRWSIAWSRVSPTGEGPLNERGMAFYDNMIDRLLDLGIESFVSLCHYDIPQALEDSGGWLNRRTTDLFAEYAGRMVDRFGDRVVNWVTFNEPACIADGHYGQTGEPPGLGSGQAAATASHNLNLAHGKAARAMKAASAEAQVSMTWNLYPVHPFHPGLLSNPDAPTAYGPLANQIDEDGLRAAQLHDGYTNRWWVDPVFRGRYPEDIWEHREFRPTIEPGDMETIHVVPDYLGVNYYNRAVSRPVVGQTERLVTDDVGRDLVTRAHGFESVQPGEYGAKANGMGWPIYPAGMREILERLQRDYTVPLFVLENGWASVTERLGDDGVLDDPERIDFIRSHIEALEAARDAGVDVRGYFVWTDMDNFEWEEGWIQKFGLIHVDQETLVRTPKASAHWYSEFVASRRESE